jgi:hypothetical protein
VILDVREGEAFRAGHIPGARHIARGQLELLAVPDPDVRILAYCELGKIPRSRRRRYARGAFRPSYRGGD